MLRTCQTVKKLNKLIRPYVRAYLTVSNLSEISKSFSLESMYKTVSSSKQCKANLPCIEHPASMYMEFVSGFSTI